MKEKILETKLGSIHYWISKMGNRSDLTLVFLPGLTADHRLFERQVEYFNGNYEVLVWDAPGHAASRPFDLKISLAEKAAFLEQILQKEEVQKPVLIGQSMGGYVAQVYAQQFPDRIRGFVSIDSSPLQRYYFTAAELWLLKRLEPVYRAYPWKALLKAGCEGVAESSYGRSLMREIMLTYNGDPAYYAKLCGEGYRMLAEAIEADLPYEIPCPALLIAGDRDHAGSVLRYNRTWKKNTGFPAVKILNAGHNSNTDAPEKVNEVLEKFVRSIEKCRKKRKKQK